MVNSYNGYDKYNGNNDKIGNINKKYILGNIWTASLLWSPSHRKKGKS